MFMFDSLAGRSINRPREGQQKYPRSISPLKMQFYFFFLPFLFKLDRVPNASDQWFHSPRAGYTYCL